MIVSKWLSKGFKVQTLRRRRKKNSLNFENQVKEFSLITLVEDIAQLRGLFHMCSFCLVKNDKYHLNSKISNDALGITLDEELLFSQCQEHWM